MRSGWRRTGLMGQINKSCAAVGDARNVHLFMTINPGSSFRAKVGEKTNMSRLPLVSLLR
eukprot:3255074-Heterocapsa_arctica.AAC.1